MPKTVILAILSILLVTAIIVQPDAAFQASLQGLTVWWNIVFPGLLPFLVLFELIAAFGLAHAFASLFQPLMSRLFKLPGEAALAIVLGWLGGYPAGAEAAASLRKRKLVTKQQGQRLLALAHMPNPLFMLVVIGAGFLHKPVMAAMIAGAVWLSALWLMFLLTLFSKQEDRPKLPPEYEQEYGQPSGMLAKAAQALSYGREQDGRSFGKALGDSVTSAVQKLMTIGGFMIFAAVLAKLAEPLLRPVPDSSAFGFLLQAFLEGHLGAYSAAAWNGTGGGAVTTAAVIAAVLAWSGLSGILQAGYFIAGTDLKLLPFLLLRSAHALHAFVFLVLLWKPVTAVLRRILPPEAVPSAAAFDAVNQGAASAWIVKANDLPALWPYSVAACAAVTLLGLALTLLLVLFRRSGRSA
ncbi:nucleoside recognition protein [Paenibacillus sp. N4]|uniref:nucleoside recognition domain-containing protein n=1 Tax=Paenibacillus vietnamensis TaxID=2590547 RepID=UPI001CD07682|nr:nucleoside recognition domain-containing protein [Paenibacillus vietnamensis]MCA0753991.1 nucleoside recognition protein [Paenibacillus vietnamensis]